MCLVFIFQFYDTVDINKRRTSESFKQKMKKSLG
jgi:hypothetical protein